MTLLFEAGLATLMIALMIYCVKLNKRLTLLRDQNAEFAEMMTGLNEASERAQQSVQHLKAAGISAEKSLRSVIDDAAASQAQLAHLIDKSSQSAAHQSRVGGDGEAPPPASKQTAADHPDGPRREKIQRDLLIDQPEDSSDGKEHMVGTPSRPKTRKEAEETVLQAIRSARVGT